MVQVPVIETPTVARRGVGVNPINARSTPTDFGAGLAQPVKQLAANAEKMQLKKEARNAMASYSKITEEVRQYTTAGDDAVFKKQGIDAEDSYKNSLQWIDETGDRYASELGSDREREAFNSMWRTHRESTLNRIAVHDATEQKAYGDSVEVGVKVSAVNTAAESYADPGIVAESLKIMDTAIRTNREGVSADIVENDVQEGKTLIHEKVIDQFLAAGNASAAKEHFNNAMEKGQIVGSKQAEITEKLNKGAVLQESQEAADALIADESLSWSERLAKARSDKKENPAVRDATVTRLKARQGEEEHLKRLDENNEMKEIQTNILDAQKNNSMSVDKQLDLAASLTDPTRRSQQIKQIMIDSRGGDTVTAPRVWAKLYRMSVDDPETFKDFPLENHLSELSQSDFKALSKWQADIGKPDSAASMRSLVNDVVKREVPAADIDFTPKEGSDDAVKVAEFMRKIWDEVERTEASSRDDIEKIVDGLMKDVKVNRDWWFDKDKKFFELDEQDIVTDIPGEHRALILDQLKNEGVQVTPKAMSDRYLQWIDKYGS